MPRTHASRRRPSWRICAAIPVAWLATGCSDSNHPAGPDPVPTGPPVIEQFVATDGSLTHGDWTQLRWRVSGADVVAISGIGSVSPPGSGSFSVRPFENTSYTLTATNGFGSATATTEVAVLYRAGVYVSSVSGDDAASGGTPAEAVRTLAEALARTQGGGAIFLSAGVYTDPIDIDGAERTIFGALDPATFFTEPETFETWIRPTGASVPLSVRNASSGVTFLSFVKLDARNGGTVAVEVDASLVVLENCTLDARLSGSGTALLVQGASQAEAVRCRILGGRKGPGLQSHANTRGVAVLDPAALLLSNCFVDGGSASQGASGVDAASLGSVRLGFNTISAQVSGSVTSDIAAAVRIRAGHPSLAGNILFTRGSVERYAIAEQADDADPSWLLGNLFLSAGTSAYDNWSGDGPDPVNEEQLNEPLYTTGDGSTLYRNLLESTNSASTVLADIDASDYHLSPSVPGGFTNPAINRGDALLLDSERFGYSAADIDGDARPGTASQYDLGADEL